MLKFGKLIIPEARIEITTKCNAHCVMCPREKLTRKKETMSTDTFKRLAYQAVELGAKQLDVFGYGEPFIDRDYISKIAFCKELGVDTAVTTNASLLTPALSAALIENGLTHIRFSLHGCDQEQYETAHKGLKWSDVFANVLKFRGLNESAGHPVKMHIYSISMNGIPPEAFRQQWEEFCDNLEVWEPHNWAGGRDYREVLFTKRTCGRPFNGPLQINVDGTIMVCCFDFDAQMVIGNAMTEPIKHIFERSLALRKIQAAHGAGIYDGLPCKECDQLRYYTESPLLYSTTDPNREIGRIAISKEKVEV